MQYEYTAKDVSRFWSKVDIRAKDQCWEWTGAKGKSGYGHVSWGGKCTRASRVSYEITYKVFPGKLDVCHKCDNRLCVNPNHLFLGTRQENMNDMIRKGRKVFLRGDQSPIHKLNSAQVSEIRQRVDAGEKQNALARVYGVCKNTIWNVVHRKYWL